MNLTRLKTRLAPGQRPTATAAFVVPSFVFEIQPDFVAGAKLDASSRRVKRMGAAGLEPNSLVAHPSRPNVSNAAALRQGIRAVREAVGNGEGRTGLLVSDGVVRVAVLPFESVPGSHAELDSLVRWRMKENLPFPPEEARLTYQISKGGPAGSEALVLAAKSSVLSEYEAALEGPPSRLILPATAALLPLLPQQKSTAQLLVNVCSGWITSVVVWENRVNFWRTREMLETELQDQFRVVATETARVVASVRDHLQVELPQVWVCVRPPVAEELVSEVARAVGQEVRLLLPAPETAASLPASERITFQRLGTALAGLLMNSG